MTRRLSSFAAARAVFLAIVLACATWASAQTETVIHSFQSNSGKDGAYPSGGLVADINGSLYGLTSGGGDGPGTIYRLSPPAAGGGWNQSILYSFTDSSDGGIPYGSLLLSKTRTLYGTASRGGLLYGVVFQLTPPAKTGSAWTETVLHTFTNGKDGAYPQSGVISNGRGTLYGTTPEGGKYQSGLVFRLSPPASPSGLWIESVLYTFTGGSDGGLPSGLVMDGTGAVYGTTELGGLYGHGAIFKLAPPQGGGPWIESTLYSFTGGSDGGQPFAGLIFDGSGNLYGTTAFGGGGSCTNSDGVTIYCGTVFELNSPPTQGSAWTEAVLYDFLEGSDGAYPESSLIFDNAGNLYGNTSVGGAGGGTAFELMPPFSSGGAWTEQTLHAFTGGSDGATPMGSLLQVNGDFYGVTWDDGARGTGTVFQLIP